MRATETHFAAEEPGARLGGKRIVQPGTVTRMGPARHLTEERQRLAGLEWEHFDLRPDGTTVGAEISGLRLTDDLDAATVGELAKALADFKVLVFRDQPMSAVEHVTLARRFGDLELHPFIPPNDEVPELVRFEKSAEVGGYENSWHHDVTWRDAPSMGAILHAIDVPPACGDTLFCDMYAAYAGLEDDMKARLDGVVAIHDFVKAFGGNIEPGREQEMRAKYPAVEHPVVVTHPVTGRKLLFVNRIFVSEIVGEDPAEMADVLEYLCRQADYPEYQYRLRWEPETVAFWDNRAVQHYAASDYWPETRIMERASIVGTRPKA